MKFFEEGERQKGFTLMELLISMTLTAVITVIMATGLSLTLRAWEGGEIKAEGDQIARVVLRKIRDETASLYPYRYIKQEMNEGEEGEGGSPTLPKSGEKVLAFDGRRDRIEFISTLPLSGANKRSGGLKKIAFHLERGEREEGKSLYVTETPFNPGEPLKRSAGRKRLLADQIHELAFRYYQIVEKSGLDKNEQSEGSWVAYFKEEVEELKNTPKKERPQLRAVEVALSLYDRDREGKILKEEVVSYPPLVVPIEMVKKIRLRK